MKKLMSLFVVLFVLCLAGTCLASPSPPVMRYETNGLNVSISWSEVPSAIGYKLYYAPYPYTGADSINHIDLGGDNSYSIDLWWGASYYIAITAYDGFSESSYSNIDLFKLGQHQGSLFDTSPFQTCNHHFEAGIPAISDQYLCRDAYSVGYNYTNKTADWVSYYITENSVSQFNQRNERFREDLEVSQEGRSTLEDYRGSGYDRGHMAPAATIDYSYNAMDESFLLTNIAPQLPSFNRGIWANLEAFFRDCAVETGELYVVTGVVFDERLDYIGNGVRLPAKFYKAALDPASAKTMAFLLPHNDISTDQWPNYLVSVDSLEAFTGIDLFSAVKDDIESTMESTNTPICQMPWAPPITPEPEPEPYNCGIRKYCGDMNSCAEAMYYLNVCGVSRLDGDNDGTPCESLCR